MSASMSAVRRRRPASVWVAVLAVLVLATAVTVLVVTRNGATEAPQTHGLSISPSTTATARAGNVAVTVGRGAVDRTGTLTVTRPPEPVEPLRGVPAGAVSVVGRSVAVSLGRAHLVKSARLTFTLPAATTARETYIVAWQDGSGGWRWLPTTVNPTGTRVSATTDHFSRGDLLKIDPSKWARSAAGWFRDYITGRTNVRQPSCGDERAVRVGGVKVTSDGGDSVKWCFGVEHGRRVLKVANNRRTFTQIAYPASWKVLNAPSLSLSDDALARSLGTMLPPRGRKVRVIDGGDTLTLRVPHRSSGHVEAEMGVLSWVVNALTFGIGVYSSIAGIAGDAFKTTVKGSRSRILEVLAGKHVDGYGEALKECTDALRNKLPGKIDATGYEVGNGIVKAGWKCLPKLMTADVKETGLRMFLAGAVIGLVGTIVGAVLTALNLVITGTRELFDQLVALGGHSDPDYDIVITEPIYPRLVGRWWVHGTVVTMNADHTGTEVDNAGPCTDSFTETQSCSTHATITFASTATRVIGRYTAVWTVNNITGKRVKNPSVPPTYHVGNTFIMWLVDDDLLKVTEPGPGNPYLCGPRLREDLQYHCGA